MLHYYNNLLKDFMKHYDTHFYVQRQNKKKVLYRGSQKCLKEKYKCDAGESFFYNIHWFIYSHVWLQQEPGTGKAAQ